jgi:hypothetical protein
MHTTQKVLLVLLYALIALMIVFSIGATKNLGKAGYDSCIQKKCDTKGQEFCTKFREVNNCCQGAGGNIGQSGCVFS